MWDDILDALDLGHDNAVEFAIDHCALGEEEAFEILYKSQIEDVWIDVRKILLEDALQQFRRAR